MEPINHTVEQQVASRPLPAQPPRRGLSSYHFLKKLGTYNMRRKHTDNPHATMCLGAPELVCGGPNWTNKNKTCLLGSPHKIVGKRCHDPCPLRSLPSAALLTYPIAVGDSVISCTIKMAPRVAHASLPCAEQHCCFVTDVRADYASILRFRVHDLVIRPRESE